MAQDVLAPVVNVRNLKVSINTPSGKLNAVNGISYQVRPGETFAIVGESGSGKSVAALSLLGLQPKAATVAAEHCEIDGNDTLGLDSVELGRVRGTSVGMIFQDPMTCLNPVLRIGQQLIEGYLRHGLGTRVEAVERAEYLLSKVGLKDPSLRMRQFPHQLSGGIRQRVMIAMALMCEPKVLFADEPTTALDVTVQAKIIELLKDIQNELGLALILITHDLGVVANIADQVAVMYAGRIVELGAADEVFSTPTHPYTQSLLGCIPQSRRGKRGRKLNAIPGIVPSLIGERTGCDFRNRCKYRNDECGSDVPRLRSIEGSHCYACVHEADWLSLRAIEDKGFVPDE